MTIPKELQAVLTSTPDTLGGSVRFVGTRVPVQALLDTVICNHTIDYFLEGYPDVSRQQADAVVKWEQNQARRTVGLDMVS